MSTVAPCKSRCCPTGVPTWELLNFSDYNAPANGIAIPAGTGWQSSFHVPTMARYINGVASPDAPLLGCRNVCGGPIWVDVTAYQPPGGNTLSYLDLAISEGYTFGALFERDLRQIDVTGVTILRATWRVSGPWFGLSLFNGDPVDGAKVDIYAVARTQ